MVVVKLAQIVNSSVVKEFTLEHAQRVYDVQKLNPPASWKLADENFKIKQGQITPVLDQE